MINLVKRFLLLSFQLTKKIIFFILNLNEDNLHERPYTSKILTKEVASENIFKSSKIIFNQLNKAKIKVNQKKLTSIVNEFFKEIKITNKIKISHDSICFNRALYLFVFIRLIKPAKIFESGVNFGFSTFIIDLANNYGAKHYAFDINFSNLKYKKKNIVYVKKDIEIFFKENFIETYNSLVFFDDHVSHAKRLSFCKNYNIQHILVDDDLPKNILFNDFSAPAPTASIIFTGNKKKSLIIKKFDTIKKIDLNINKLSKKNFSYHPLKELKEATGFITFSPMSYVKLIQKHKLRKRNFIIYNASSDDMMSFWIEKFGLNNIRKSKSFEITYVNAQKCFFNKSFKSNLKDKVFNKKLYFSSLRRLEDYFKKIDKSSVIWVLNYGHDYQLKILDILNSFKLKSLFHQYLLFHQPVPFMEKKKKINSYLKIINFLRLIITRKIFFKNSNPTAVIYSGRMGRYLGNFLFPKSRLLSTLSPIIYTNEDKFKKNKKKYLVYVAQDVLIKTVDKLMFDDTSMLQQTDKLRHEFYKNLNLLLDLIEKKFNCEVIIALKRKSEIKYFTKRKKYYKCSDNLIKNSTGVIGHFSTQLLASHLYRKKTLLIHSDIFNDIQKLQFNNFSKSFYNNHKYNMEKLIKNLKNGKSKIKFYYDKEYSKKITDMYITDDINNINLNKSITSKLKDLF